MIYKIGGGNKNICKGACGKGKGKSAYFVDIIGGVGEKFSIFLVGF